MRRAYLIPALAFFSVLAFPGFSIAQKQTAPAERIVVCILELEHADAEYLASVLKPFLSPEGSLVPYKPTNSLIIKDREPVVNRLAELIKGKPCIPISQSPNAESNAGQKKSDLGK